MLFLIVTVYRKRNRPLRRLKGMTGNHAIDPLDLATLSSLRRTEPVAQPVEQLTFNQ
jgi:hypothetical protein